MSALESFREHGLKYFTPKRAWHWLVSVLRRTFGGRKLKTTEVIDFAEVIVYRSSKCPECKAAGKCVVCQCPFKDLISTMDASCSKERWFGLGNNWREKWNKQKEEEGISFFIINNK